MNTITSEIQTLIDKAVVERYTQYVSAKSKEYYAKYKESDTYKKYKESDTYKETRRIRNAAYYADNCEKLREDARKRQKVYYQLHKEELRQIRLQKKQEKENL